MSQDVGTWSEGQKEDIRGLGYVLPEYLYRVKIGVHICPKGYASKAKVITTIIITTTTGVEASIINVVDSVGDEETPQQTSAS